LSIAYVVTPITVKT